MLLHVINGGLEVHEAIIGDAGGPGRLGGRRGGGRRRAPGPTPVVSVPPDVAGLRIVVALRGARGRRLDGAGGPTGEIRADSSSAVTSPATGNAACRIPVRWVDAS